MRNQEFNLVEIDSNSPIFKEATKCFKIPPKYFNDFFSEIVKQNGIKDAFRFIERECTLRECFAWRESVKGIKFWSDVEDEMLKEVGIISEIKRSEEEPACQHNISLDAIHESMMELLATLKQR